jgi:CzcA family heavy metal efflux pump
MNFIEWIQAHRRSILFLIAALAIGGIFSSYRLPVSLFPHVNFPRIVVNLDAGDRPANRMEIEVTQPVEEAIRTVPGVLRVRSTTSRGGAEISINFDWNQDMVAAMLQVESAINRVTRSLPNETVFTVRRMDVTVFPVLGYSVISDQRSLIQLRDIALYQLRPVLTTVPGIARIGVLGGEVEEYHVVVDSVKLNAYGLTISEVANALAAANVITAVGKLEDHNKLYLIVSDTKYQQLDQIQKTILRSGSNGIVRVEDVAMVRQSSEPQWIRITADGHEAVLFEVYQQPGGNTVEIAKNIKEQLALIKKRLPSDVKIANWYDQSDLIIASANSVRDALILGVLLGAGVLFLFLRNWKVTLIAVLTVPAALATTILLLYVFGMSFNIMTLGGMAAAVGLIIDDAIVMIEHVIRRLRSGEGHPNERALKAAKEFTRPLSGSSAATIIIFTPLAFLSGVTGAFFKTLSLTMATSLIISYLIAWMAVPLLAIHFLNRKDAEQEEHGWLTHQFHRIYAAVMKRLLPHPWIGLVLIFPLLAGGWFAYSRTGSGFMPIMDEGGFILDYVAPPGTSLTETDRLLRQIEAILRKTPEVETYSRRAGIQLGGFLTEANTGDFFVRLKSGKRRNIEQIMDDIRSQIEKTIPGLEIEMLQLMEDLIGDLTAVPQPIEVKIFSDDANLLTDTAPKVAAALGKIPGVVDVKNGIVLAGDALVVHVDPDKAAIEGVDPQTVTNMVTNELEGMVNTAVQKGPKMVNIRVWIPKDERLTQRQIEMLQFRAPDGHLFPLNRIATIDTDIGQAEINREDLKRMVAVTGRIADRDLGFTIRDVKAVLNQPGLIPHNAYYQLGGLYAEQQAAFKGLIIVFISAVILVFLLLLFLYERFRVTLAMMFTTLSGLSAVFIGLYITGTELNISAMMGMTMIVGIITEVGIFYLSEYYDLSADLDPIHRMILAGKNRMRPIAMTTFAAILALLPLALGIGQGAAMQKPLAIAIISGLVIQIPQALVFLPLMLTLLGIKRKANNS